jgi:ribonuclease T1
VTLHRLPPSDDGRRARTTGAAAFVVVLVAVLGVWLLNGRDPGTGTSPGPSDESSDTVVVGADDGFVRLDSLPPEAAETVALIDAGGPFPYEEDGGVFGNYEGLLPDRERGYYREYTVETPGSDDRGARRIVTGEEGELYWTDDHYASFDQVVR